MKIAKLPYAEMRTMGVSDIILIEFPAPMRVDLAIAQELVSWRIMFTENRPHYVIIDMTNIEQMDANARDFMRHPDGGLKNIRAGALLASNPVSAMLANFFVKAPKDFPARYFYSKQDALDWLMECRSGQERSR